ncbi:hypothetical protein J6590_087377, partial [Homalodisca vitripennis]
IFIEFLAFYRFLPGFEVADPRISLGGGRPLLAAATDLGACPRPTALPRARRRSSVTAGTQLTRGANSRAARVARLRRPYGPASDFLGPCRLSYGKHFASPGLDKMIFGPVFAPSTDRIIIPSRPGSGARVVARRSVTGPRRFGGVV